MRRTLGLLVLGLLCLPVQGALAVALPAPWCPDLGLVVVAGLGLWLQGASGLGAAAGLGYVADLLSGSLLGQHALLRTIVYGATRIAHAKLNLSGWLSRALLVGLLSLGNGIVLAGLVALFGGRLGPAGGFLRELLLHAVVNAAVAPFVLSAVDAVARLLVGDDERRRPLRLRRPGHAT